MTDLLTITFQAALVMVVLFAAWRIVGDATYNWRTDRTIRRRLRNLRR